MTDNVYTPDQFRPHWGGVDADNDIHIEAYDRDVQTRLRQRASFWPRAEHIQAAESQQPIPH
jgi:hypothetical protein